MKKTLIALAALASTAAFAQSSVTLSGAVAVSIQNTSAAKTAAVDLSDADLKATVKEDLGGGLSATATMRISNEGNRGAIDLTAGKGTGGVAVEETTLALAGGFGKISYSNVLSGKAKLSAGVSVEDDMSDAIGYYSNVNVFHYDTPELTKGLTGFVEVVSGDAANLKAPANVKLNADPTVGLNYANGPVWAYGEYTQASKEWDVRASYDLGAAKVAARITDDKRASGRTSEVAVTAPMGATTVGVHYAKNDIATAYGFSAAYALSKNTSVIAGYVKSDAAAASPSIAAGTGFTGNNYRVQLKQAF